MNVIVQVGQNDFPMLAARFDDALEQARDRAIATVIATADPLTPRRTGALIANKAIQRWPDGFAVEWTMFYAGYVNFGTRYIVGKHFAERGADAGVPPFLAVLAALGG